MKLRSPKEKKVDWLQDVLFTYPTDDDFTVRDMLRSVQIKGITGSGKSSGSGAFLFGQIARHPRSVMVVLCQKPEEKDLAVRTFEKYGKPYRVIEPGKGRCNILDYHSRKGADTRSNVEFLSVVAEGLDGPKGKNIERFWVMLEERITFCAIELVKQGNGVLSATDLLSFLTTAPYKPADLIDPAWQARAHNQTNKRAYERNSSKIERINFELAHAFFNTEFVHMDERPRSSGLAAVMNTLFTFCTGEVNDMCAAETELDPDIIDQGVSLIINYPFYEHGATGRFIAGTWKYSIQKKILRDKWDGRFFTVLWADESQESYTSFDPKFLVQCRSHGGCMVSLTQTINSEYARMNKYEADQLLSNYGTSFFHLSDTATAKWASDMLGMQREPFITISPNRDEYGGSLSEQYQPIIQPANFMRDLLTGGPPHYMVDSIAIRLGPRFKNGQNWQYVTYKQEDP